MECAPMSYTQPKNNKFFMKHLGILTNIYINIFTSVTPIFVSLYFFFFAIILTVKQ